MWTERTYEARISPMKQTNIRYLLAHAGPVSWKVQYPVANPPRWRSISWMVRFNTTEPSMLEVDIMEGSRLRSEPSTLGTHFMEGSAARGELSTLKANIVDGSMLTG